jgi:hypothetical protein
VAPPPEEPLDERAEVKAPVGAAPGANPTYVRHRLRGRALFWRTFVKSTLVMSWILHGYSIAWHDGPQSPWSEPNRDGALAHTEFTTQAVQSLLAKGVARAVTDRPTVVSPLNVVERRGKLRLTLDLEHVNQHVSREGTKFKYESLQQGCCNPVASCSPSIWRAPTTTLTSAP